MIYRNWVKGWNGGLTGPNTPSTPTVRMSLDMRAHYKDLENWKSGMSYPKSPSCCDYYIPIACGSDTVAIAVGPDREEIATLIAKAPQMEQELAIARDRIVALERTLKSIAYVVDEHVKEEL